MKSDGDDLITSSGRRIEANLGIIGLSPDLVVYSGYDNGIGWPAIESVLGSQNENAFTKPDMIELADHMIERWKQFKATLDSTKNVPDLPGR